MDSSSATTRVDTQRINNLSSSINDRSSFLEDAKNKSLLNSSFQIRKSYDIPIYPKLSSSENHKFHRLLDHFENDEVVKRKKEEEMEKKFIKNMETSFEMVYEDKEPKPIVGELAVENYYKHYKKLRVIHEQNKLFSMRNPPIETSHTSLLSKSEDNLILPSKMGLIKYTGDESKVEVKNYKYGDQYIEMLSEGLRLVPNIQELHLSGNRISNVGAQALLPQLSKNTRVLDLSCNNIGKLGIDYLCQTLKGRDCRLEDINIEDNKLGDQACIKLCETLMKNKSIRRLNMSKNFLTNTVAESIKGLLISNVFLQELYLHWNQIKASGAIVIFQGIHENEGLRVLDFSWNSIGGGTISVVPQILDCFANNDKIMHLDLSNNYFTLEESKLIAAGLENNHTIYGFHFTGNYGYVDSRGFLIIDDEQVKHVNELHTAHRIEGIGLVKTHRMRKYAEEAKDCCWLCEGWSEREFYWRTGESGDANSDPIFIHFDFEKFEGVWMGSKNKNNVFLYKRIVPPGKLTYFFTADEIQVPNLLYPMVEATDSLIQNVKLGKRMLNVKIDKRNLDELHRKKDVLTKNFVPTISIPPRTRDPRYIPPRLKKQKREWSFPISLFKDWKKDDEELLKKCFEYDWSCSRIPRVVKKEEDIAATKEIWRAVYKQYKETYKYYASLNPVGEIWSITQNPFTDFINSCEIIDGKTIKLSDVDLKFIATFSGGDLKSNPRNPDRSLIRFQLMECLTRIAEEKYVKSGQFTTFAESVDALIKDHCNKVFSQYNAQKWRDERYWNEECDDVLKSYKSVLDNVYQKYSVKKKKPGEKNFMCLDELSDVCKHANLYDENFVERDMTYAFNIGMMTMWDELSTDRIFKMTFVEFLEAFARIAEKLSPLPIGATPGPEWTYEKRYATPLHYKIEALIFRVMPCCCDTYIRESVKIPTISMFDGDKGDEYEDVEY